jgi:hypothetical protein
VCEVGIQLGLSKHTVHTYLARIYRKLAVNSCAQLTARLFVTYIEVEKHLLSQELIAVKPASAVAGVSAPLGPARGQGANRLAPSREAAVAGLAETGA